MYLHHHRPKNRCILPGYVNDYNDEAKQTKELLRTSDVRLRIKIFLEQPPQVIDFAVLRLNALLTDSWYVKEMNICPLN